jgi:hypothetical protein
MTKRGAVQELLVWPAFAIVLALGMLLPALFVLINEVSDPVEFEERFHSRNLALLIDAVQSVPPEINLNIKYPLPDAFHAEITPFRVDVFTSSLQESSHFFYSRIPYLNIVPSSVSSSFFISKDGSVITFQENPVPVSDSFCPDVSGIDVVRLGGSDESRRLSAFSDVFSFSDGDFSLGFDTDVEDGFIDLLVPGDRFSFSVACYLQNAFQHEFPDLIVRVVPVNVFYEAPHVQELLSGPGVVVSHPGLRGVESVVFGGLSEYGVF